MPYGIPYYGNPLYGEKSYNPRYIWAIEIDWDNDGYYDGYNEAMRCVGLSIRRGRELPVRSRQGFEHVDVGEARITLVNNDDRYNYYNTSSPYYPNVKQGKYIRIRVLDGATSTPVSLFTGIITDIELQEEGRAGSTAILTCKDGWYFLEQAKTNIAVSSSYTTGTAIQAILTDIGWPSHWGTNIDAGIDSLDYFWATNKNAREAIDELNDSEFGTVRIIGDGTFEFYERGHEPTAGISLTQADLLTDIQLPAPWKTTRNKAIVHVYPRTLREDVEIYTMSGVPSIAPDETFVEWGNFSYESRNVASNSITTPVDRNAYEDKNTIAFVASTKKITDSANGLAVFTTGMKITVSGASGPTNNGTFTVATGGVAGEIVVSETLVDESAGSNISIVQLVSDYTVNDQEDGEGNDLSAYVTVTAELYGEQVKTSIKNLHPTSTMYVTHYRIVGDAIDTPHPTTAEYDASGTDDVKPFELDVPWITVTKFGQNYADFLGDYLNATDPFPIIKMENKPDFAFSGELFDKIGLSIDKFGIDAADYKISKIEHNWNVDTGQSITTTWYTEKRAAVASGGDAMNNGDFETGDLTNWTQVGTSMSVVSSDKYEGDYSLKIDAITTGTKTLTSDRITVVEDQTYKIKLATKETFIPPSLSDLQCSVSEMAYVDSGNPTTNYHDSNIIGGDAGDAYRAFFKIDFSGIPSGAVVKEATLVNNLTSVNSSLDTELTVLRATESWTDTTITWNNQPEYEPTGIGSYALLSNEATGAKSINLSAFHVNELHDGTFTDNGFALIASPEGGAVETTKTIYWREYYIVGYKYPPYRVPIYDYVIKSKTTTVSTAATNKYTFSNAPYVDVTYDTVSHPRPDYDITIKWYDHATAGGLLRTDTICSENKQTEWNIRSIQLNSPTGALSAEIIISATKSQANVYIDDISIIPQGYY